MFGAPVLAYSESERCDFRRGGSGLRAAPSRESAKSGKHIDPSLVQEERTIESALNEKGVQFLPELNHSVGPSVPSSAEFRLPFS